MKSIQNVSSRIKEIEDFARKNDNEVSLFVVQDIIKNKTVGIDEDLLNRVLNRLRKEGIRILPLDMDEGYKTDLDEPDKFIPSDVNITQVPTNVSNIMERLENEEYNLTPAFQRHGGLWSVEKQGMQYLRDINGKTFDELPRQYIRRIKESSIVAYTVTKGTPEEVVFNVFQRINTGGVQLNDQEIRQALYSGRGTDLIKEMAEMEEFKEATQFAVKPERMLDREYALRFLSFTELDYEKEYKGNIDSFLIKGLKKANTFDKKECSRVTRRYVRVMKACKSIFGKYAFRKYNKNFRRGPINKAIFEIWAICFGELIQLVQEFKGREERTLLLGILTNKGTYKESEGSVCEIDGKKSVTCSRGMDHILVSLLSNPIFKLPVIKGCIAGKKLSCGICLRMSI